jgi:hypothetical protein
MDGILIIELDGIKFLRGPNGKLLNPKISFNPNLANLASYKAQIRWFESLYYWFKNTGDLELANGYKKIAKIFRKKLQDVAR